MEQKKREFTIWIHKNTEWEIRFSKWSAPLEPNGRPQLDVDAFAVRKRTEDGKIGYLFDMDVLDEDLLLVKQDERFYERCIFIRISFDMQTVVEEFEGTFIDALEYIKRNLNE